MMGECQPTSGEGFVLSSGASDGLGVQDRGEVGRFKDFLNLTASGWGAGACVTDKRLSLM